MPAFFFSSKKTSINKPFLFCLSTAINIIIFKQINQHHHFSSKAINIIILQAKQSTSSFFKQSNQHHHFQAKQSTSSLFKQSKQRHHFSSDIVIFGQYHYSYLLAFYLLHTSVDMFRLGSILIILFKQTVLRQAPEMYDILNMPCDSRGLLQHCKKNKITIASINIAFVSFEAKQGTIYSALFIRFTSFIRPS